MFWRPRANYVDRVLDINLFLNVLEAQGYVDRVLDINLFLFAKRASICDEF